MPFRDPAARKAYARQWATSERGRQLRAAQKRRWRANKRQQAMHINPAPLAEVVSQWRTQ